MNKNKKVDKNEKFKIVLKRIINIFCYVCTGITLLFLIIYGCFGCSNNNDQAKANVNFNENQFALRNNASYQFNTKNDSIAFGLRSGDSLKKPSYIVHGQYINQYTVSLGSNNAVVVRDSNDSVVGLDEQWTLYFNIHSPFVSGDYIRIETPNWTRVYSVDLSSDTFYVSSQVSPENYLYDEIYLPVNLGYYSENYEVFKRDMNIYFIQISFVDYRLSDNWNPYNFVYSNNEYRFMTVGRGGELNIPIVNSFVNNAVYGNSFKLLDTTLFSINGYLYTDLLCHVQVITAPVWDVYYDNYNEVRNIYTGQGQSTIVYFIDYVYAYNNSTEDSLVIWSIPYEDNSNHYSVYAFEKGFSTADTSLIRLFSRHLFTETVKGYNNGNILQVDGSVIFNGGGYDNGGSLLDGLGGVFVLIGNAFGGMSNLMNIQIGSGLTLLSFILIPLTVTIILAVIQLFKR